ncbi:MAG: hypothetical protein EXR70_07000 [Deltaproteobacteria bacterium]|nr:hypothetical protein [Deltaproteobacteria bacterium]
MENADYLIKGKIPPVVQQQPKPSLLRSVRDLFSKPPAPAIAEKTNNEIELRFSPNELQALAARVRADRKPAPESPDPHSVSQLLRGIGCHLDKRRDCLLVSLAVEDRWVTIVSRNRAGELQKTQQDLEYFYNLWVKMYLQRGDRPNETLHSDPTFCVPR